MKIVQVITDYKDVLDIEVVLGNVCNYKCSYCFEGYHEGDNHWPKENFNLVVNNLLKLMKFYEINHGKKRFNLKPIGGEPTLWPLLDKFILTLKNEFDVYIRLSTNASRTLRYWEENTKLFDEIIISVHPEFTKPDHIISVSDFIYKSRLSNLYINVLMNPFDWKKSVNVLEYLKNNSKGWHLNTSPVLIKGEAIYDDEQIKFLNSFEKITATQPKHFQDDLQAPIFIGENYQILNINKSQIMYNNLHRFKGYKCNLGIDRVYIGQDGIVSGACGQKIFQPLNIFKTDIEPILVKKNEPVICEKEKCSCSAEIILSKSKVLSE